MIIFFLHISGSIVNFWESKIIWGTINEQDISGMERGPLGKGSRVGKSAHYKTIHLVGKAAFRTGLLQVTVRGPWTFFIIPPKVSPHLWAMLLSLRGSSVLLEHVWCEQHRPNGLAMHRNGKTAINSWTITTPGMRWDGGRDPSQWTDVSWKVLPHFHIA